MRAVLDWFGAERYLEHAVCLTNDPILMALYFVGDMVIFASYFIIGGALILQFARSQIIRIPNHMRLLYGAFIFLCGLTHLTKTITLFSGVYRIDIAVVAATAAVSATTAVFVGLQAASRDA